MILKYASYPKEKLQEIGNRAKVFLINNRKFDKLAAIFLREIEDI
jgi:hypothetical protein